MFNLNNFITSYNNINHKNISSMLMILNDWNFIHITGDDAKQYLQNQLTTDIHLLNPKEHILTAHCNSKGKVWSTLRLFHYHDGYGYILRKSVTTQQINEFKKYATFSKVIIKEPSNIILLGIIDNNQNNILTKFFPKLPKKKNLLIHYEYSTLLYFDQPIQRFLIITNKNISDNLIKQYSIYGNSDNWLALDIAAGIPNIDIENTATFIPQSINLDNIKNSINFQKGCYMGQEIISRTKYKNSNKRNMYWLIGTGSYIPKIGHSIEWEKNKNYWCNIGIILSAIKLKNNLISLQIVFNNTIPKDSNFRLIGDLKSKLLIQL